MNDHSIFICRCTYVDATVLTLCVVNIKTVFSHLTASLREGRWGRSGPFNLRGRVSKEVTLQFCFFSQKASNLSRRRLGEPWLTCGEKKTRRLTTVG